MAYDEENNDVMNSLPSNTDETKNELYMYSLRKMAEHNMESNRNPITNLYNFRTFLYKSAEIMLENPQKKFAMIVLDIANFKTVNEFCGRDAGDNILIAISDGLRQYENEDTIISQFRADNFGMLVPFIEEQELVDITVNLSRKIASVKLACKVLPAFGICVALDSTMPTTIMKDYATMAMKTIKGKFYANYAFFDEKI